MAPRPLCSPLEMNQFFLEDGQTGGGCGDFAATNKVGPVQHQHTGISSQTLRSDFSFETLKSVQLQI